MPHDHDVANHPRPQLVRAGATILDGPWGFAVDSAGKSISDRWFERSDPFDRTIQVPFPPESSSSGIRHDVDGPVWYRREFDHRARGDDRLLVHFEGVDHRASVWVNGEHVGDHEGSQSRFSFDITDQVRDGANHIVVRAIDGTDLEQPRGKQDWLPEPHDIWYRRTSGIWRTVWLERVPPVRIDRLVLIPEADLSAVRLEARAVGDVIEGTRLELEFRHEGVLLSKTGYEFIGGVVRGRPVLVRPGIGVQPELLWWSPESPVLIDVSARIVRDGVTIDDVESYVGLRHVSTDESRVLLNGRPLFLRLVLEQGYWPDTHLASPSLEALEEEARLIKALGFNGLRMHQTSADPRFLAACDRIGLVVFADAAAAYEFSDVALSRTVAEVTALIRRDLSHPSVIGWVPFNESWGLPHLPTDEAQRAGVRALYELVKALDPSRIAIGNDGWEFVAGDLIGVHDYAQTGDELSARYSSLAAARQTVATRRPGGRVLAVAGSEEVAARVPVILSEFGGISVHDASDAWAAYGEVLTPEELVRRLTEMISAIGPSSGLAGYCYTQLTDTLQEMNGLLTDTREPKAPLDALRAAFLAG